jgi:two-component system response regulator QseB
MHALLVEDDKLIAEGILTALRQEGYAADWLRDGSAAAETLRSRHFDIVLLDLGLPRKDGLAVLREMRAHDDATPVIIVTARDEVRERVAGLDAGADDYLIKPFEIDELIARMRSVRRRSAGRAHPVLAHGAIRLDTVSHTVQREGQPVTLSPREFAILEALMQRPGTVLSRRQLEERIYGWNEEVDSNAVEVHVHSLRRKLGPGAIRTLRGVGYCMDG